MNRQGRGNGLWNVWVQMSMEALRQGCVGAEGEELWTVRQVAAHCRVHEKTVYKWVESRTLGCIRVGNRLRFRPSDITRWLASRKEG